MALKEETRPELWTVLKRRKRSIRNFLEGNSINSVDKFESWMKLHSHEYTYSPEFVQEVLQNHLIVPSEQSTQTPVNALVELPIMSEGGIEEPAIEEVAVEHRKKKKKILNGLESE